MANTARDHTEELRDRDNTGGQATPPPKRPAPESSAHIPGGATEMAEENRVLQPETVGDKDDAKKGS